MPEPVHNHVEGTNTRPPGVCPACDVRHRAVHDMAVANDAVPHQETDVNTDATDATTDQDWNKPYLEGDDATAARIAAEITDPGTDPIEAAMAADDRGGMAYLAEAIGQHDGQLMNLRETVGGLEERLHTITKDVQDYINDPFTDAQRARAKALRAARDTIASKGSVFGGSNVNSRDISDLITLAGWIMTGWEDELSEPGTDEDEDFTDGVVE